MTPAYDQIGVRYHWTGGDCPVDGGALVKVTFCGGPFPHIHPASYWDWQHQESAFDIEFFEIVEFPQ